MFRSMLADRIFGAEVVDCLSNGGGKEGGRSGVSFQIGRNEVGILLVRIGKW